MTFLLPTGLTPDAVRELERACVAGGPDNMPLPTQARVEADRLTLQRGVDESGFLNVPWTVEDAGLLMNGSATLAEQPRPYHLQIELARGKVNQVRGQAWEWRSGGLQASALLDQHIRDATLAFGRALQQQPNDPAGLQAEAALNLGYRAANYLVQVYIDQVYQIRHERQPRLDVDLGCRLDRVPAQRLAAASLARACNSICISMPWNEIEPSADAYCWEAQDAVLAWAGAEGLKVTAGPLIDFSSARLPDWLWHWERDLSKLADFMCRYVETTVRRYRGRISRWQLTAASNWASLLALGEDELLWLTVKLAQVARQVDPALDLVVGIAQPWGEYLALEDRVHSPFVFADTLVRSGINLAGLDIEIVMGVTPRGSYCRDLLETSRLLDLYSFLSVPLQVTLGYPSATTPDLEADPELRVDAGHWRGGISSDVQADWAAAFAALALCKPYIQGVFWVHASDANPHQFPHCGLVDAQGNCKPVLTRLTELRERHLR